MQITLARELTILHFKEGETVLFQGEPATFFGVILKGALVPVVGHERMAQAQRGVGEVIGEMSLFTGGTRNVSVEAAADGYLAVFSFAQLEALQRTNRGLADKLARQLALAALEKQMQTDGRAPPHRTRALDARRGGLCAAPPTARVRRRLCRRRAVRAQPRRDGGVYRRAARRACAAALGVCALLG